MLGVVLARFARVMGGVRGMAVRGVRMVAGLLVVVGRVMRCGFAMMPRGMLVVFGGGVVVLDDPVLGHDALRGCFGRDEHRPGMVEPTGSMLQLAARQKSVR